jgi:hypothetical protein
MKMTILSLILSLVLFGCASTSTEETPLGLKITEIQPNKWTALTKQNLFQLAQVYDLSPLLFTKEIHVQSKVIPKSHPILTLNTRNAEHPKRLLSTFLHEQLHWWAVANSTQMNQAVKELKKIYPNAPITKSGGANSTHTHLIVCYLEYRALAFYLGEKESREVITVIMKKDKIYPWIYYQVLNKGFVLKKMVKKYKLLPPPLS